MPHIGSNGGRPDPTGWCPERPASPPTDQLAAEAIAATASTAASAAQMARVVTFPMASNQRPGPNNLAVRWPVLPASQVDAPEGCHGRCPRQRSPCRRARRRSPAPRPKGWSTATAQFEYAMYREIGIATARVQRYIPPPGSTVDTAAFIRRLPQNAIDIGTGTVESGLYASGCRGDLRR